MEKANTISTREKMGALLKRFLRWMDDQRHTIFELGWLLNEGSKIFKDSRKALDIICYFEALGLIMRISQEHAVYVGFRGMVRKLMEFEARRQSESDSLYEEMILYGKPTNVKSQYLAGQLLANVFFGMIYQQDSTTKSSIEETVENFMHQQKEVNLKNFVPEVLNILGIVGLIEKNEATEVVSYVGPDLRCYDDSNKKIAWKMFEISQKEEQAVGKDTAENNTQQSAPLAKNLHDSMQDASIGSTTPIPMHISYFAEVGYAILRSPNWDKHITSTIFFIGRTERRLYDYTASQNHPSKTYRIDLELPYRSVSRQHALIVFNFEAQRWEIRCLSHKNLIRVDEERFAWGDKNIWLKNKSEIQIGPEKMVFMEVSNVE